MAAKARATAWAQALSTHPLWASASGLRERMVLLMGGLVDADVLGMMLTPESGGHAAIKQLPFLEKLLLYFKVLQTLHRRRVAEL